MVQITKRICSIDVENSKKVVKEGYYSVWLRRFSWSSLLVAVFSLWLMSQASIEAAPLTADTTRLFGPTRIETAIRISLEGWGSANTVLLARADDFPDSLVSVPLSRRYDAPILLTYPSNLDEGVFKEIKRLNAKHIILLGGSGVLGTTITDALEKENLTWERIGGIDRYDTAVQVAKRLGGNGQVILTNGENFPDALAIGPYAGMTETPILLTTSTVLPEVTQKKLEEYGAYKLNNGAETVAKTYVIGGEAVVSPKVVEGLTATTRIAGKDRYETAARAYWFTQEQLEAKNSSESDGGDQTNNLPITRKAFLVTGENFPDALVTGALAVKQNAALFMSMSDYLPVMTYSAMGNAAEDKLWVILVGGEPILSKTIQGIVEGTIQHPSLLAGVTIVVDPGHGGKDTGAIGASGLYEKNYTLPIGLYLADLLRQAGAKVVLTRTGDYSPAGANYTEKNDLEARVKIANQNKADLYVSIHNDSFSNPEAGGITTYISADNPEYIRSQKLGTAVQAEVIKQVGLQNRKVKTANFFVIKNTTMPSILVELGFISNPIEEKLIATADFQQKSARGIYRGILINQGY